jgi:hypothetical protein
MGSDGARYLRGMPEPDECDVETRRRELLKWLRRVDRGSPAAAVTRASVLSALDEGRGPWPDARPPAGAA